MSDTGLKWLEFFFIENKETRFCNLWSEMKRFDKRFVRYSMLFKQFFQFVFIFMTIHNKRILNKTNIEEIADKRKTFL